MRRNGECRLRGCRRRQFRFEGHKLVWQDDIRPAVLRSRVRGLVAGIRSRGCGICGQAVADSLEGSALLVRGCWPGVGWAGRLTE